MVGDEAVIGIEEPEAHIHPRAQRDLVETLAAIVKGGRQQFILSTHSERIVSRLLVLVAKGKLSVEDVAVYAFDKDGEGVTSAAKCEIDENGQISRRHTRILRGERRGHVGRCGCALCASGVVPAVLFLLDENVLIRAIARGEVDYQSGRYVRVGDEDRSAFELLVAIMENRHGLAISAELWERYAQHRSRLQSSGIVLRTHTLWIVICPAVDTAGPRRNSLGTILLKRSLPDSFPTKDRYLAHLALATGAALVTEDSGVLAMRRRTENLGFEILTIDQALERARERA